MDVDYDKSAHYYEIACERGYKLPPYLYVFIGGSYMSETGDPQEAMRWFQRGADAGVDYAYACMGQLYYEGRGVERDYRRAYELFVKSGEKETLPLYYLALMYENGYYV